MDENRLLEIEHLSVRFEVDGDVIRAVNDVSLSVEKGRTLGLVGETGAGKTTTALAALRLVQQPPGIISPESRITVCGKDMMALNARELARTRGADISMIFQDPMTSLNPVYTVGEQIAESIYVHVNCTKKEAYQRALDMLEVVGIPRDRGSEYPHQFSGGMKQRVVIAIALACNPKVLIADEPTTALDVTIQAQVLDLMKNLKQKYETGMIMITHDLGIVADICDDVAVMYAGRIVEQGTLREVFKNTLHPYTEGLFNSLPDIRNRKAKLIPIPGLMPDPANLPEGCAFAPRCRYASEECVKRLPELTGQEGTHRVACLAYERPGFLLERNKAL